MFAVNDEFGELVPAAAIVPTASSHAGSLPADLLRWQCERLSRPYRLVHLHGRGTAQDAFGQDQQGRSAAAICQ